MHLQSHSEYWLCPSLSTACWLDDYLRCTRITNRRMLYACCNWQIWYFKAYFAVTPQPAYRFSPQSSTVTMVTVDFAQGLTECLIICYSRPSLALLNTRVISESGVWATMWVAHLLLTGKNWLMSVPCLVKWLALGNPRTLVSGLYAVMLPNQLMNSMKSNKQTLSVTEQWRWHSPSQCSSVRTCGRCRCPSTGICWVLVLDMN